MSIYELAYTNADYDEKWITQCDNDGEEFLNDFFHGDYIVFSRFCKDNDENYQWILEFTTNQVFNMKTACALAYKHGASLRVLSSDE